MPVTKLSKKPRILYLLLCDTVAQDSSGKKSLIGTFDRIFSTELPCVLQRFSIVTGWWGLEGDSTMTVEIEDPEEGRRIFTTPPLGLRFKGPLCRADFVVEVESLKFERYGVYQVRVFLEKIPVSSFPLFVQKGPGNGAGRQI